MIIDYDIDEMIILLMLVMVCHRRKPFFGISLNALIYLSWLPPSDHHPFLQYWTCVENGYGSIRMMHNIMHKYLDDLPL